MNRESSFSRRRIASYAALFLIISGVCTALPKLENEGGKQKEITSESMAKPDRIWDELCSTSDIVIIQGPTKPLPSGVPAYTVEIMNVCLSGHNISRIHLRCGWFSSARLVNPRIFKRLRFDDCLVNDGKPLLNGRTLSFQYANTFSFPLAVSSVTC